MRKEDNLLPHTESNANEASSAVDAIVMHLSENGKKLDRITVWQISGTAKSLNVMN